LRPLIILLSIIIPATTAVTLTIFVFGSTIAADPCIPDRCAEVDVKGTKYELRNEAFAAYQRLENHDAPLNTMKFESEFLSPDVLYLINIDGDAPGVDSYVEWYSVNETGSKISGDGRLKSLYGFISKENLDSLLKEATPDTLAKDLVYIYPVGSVTLSEGNTVYREEFLNATQQEQVTVEHQQFLKGEVEKIVTGSQGVKKLYS
jgi:hypothetical protein